MNQTSEIDSIKSAVTRFKRDVVAVAMYRLSMDVPQELTIPTDANEVKIRSFGLFGRDKETQKIVKEIVQLTYALDAYLSNSKERVDLVKIKTNAYFHAITTRIMQLEFNSDTQRRLKEKLPNETITYRVDDNHSHDELSKLKTKLNLMIGTFDRLKAENPLLSKFLTNHYKKEIPLLSESLQDKLTSLITLIAHIDAHIQTEKTDHPFENELMMYQRIIMTSYINHSNDISVISTLEKKIENTPHFNLTSLDLAFSELKKLWNAHGATNVDFNEQPLSTPIEKVKYMLSIYNSIPVANESHFKENKEKFIGAMGYPTAERIQSALQGLDKISENAESMQKSVKISEINALKNKIKETLVEQKNAPGNASSHHDPSN